MMKAFRRWALENRLRLEQSGISLDLSEGSEGLPKNGISAVLKSNRFEATVELWETGESEFYFLDFEAGDSPPDVQVMHHEFQNEGELFMALTDLVHRMSPNLEREAAGRGPAVAGRV